MLWVTKEAPSNAYAKLDTYYFKGDLDILRPQFLTFGVPYEDHGDSLEIGSQKFKGAYEVARRLEVEIILDEKTQTIVNKYIKENKLTLRPNVEDVVVYPSFLLEPFYEQKEALIFGMQKEQFLLADTPGSGKSFSSVMLAEYLKAHYGFKHTLIICGVSSNQRNWAKEIPEYTKEKHRILGARTLNKGKPTERIEVSGNAPRVEDLQSDLDEFYLITNIHSLQDVTRGKKKEKSQVTQLLEEMIARGDIGFIIVDEIHLCTSTKSSQGKNLDRLRPYFRLGMSGTPMNTPEDLYPIATWLGRTQLGKEDFLSQYGEFVENYKLKNMSKSKGMRFVPKVYQMTNTAKFKYDLEKYMLRRDKASQNLLVPAFEDIYIELSKEQRDLYDKAVEDNNIFTKDITSIMDLAEQQKENASPKYHPARQALAMPHAFGCDKDAKLEKVEELLEKHLALGDKVIIFTFYIETAKQYEKVLGKKFKRGLFITSDSKDTDGDIERFKDGEYDYIVGGTKRIGTGHNLQQANIVIFADRPETWNVYEQNYKRAWRVGQEKKVVIYKLIAPDTWDDAISMRLHEQKTLTDSILGKTIDHESVIDGRNNT